MRALMLLSLSLLLCGCDLEYCLDLPVTKDMVIGEYDFVSADGESDRTGDRLVLRKDDSYVLVRGIRAGKPQSETGKWSFGVSSALGKYVILSRAGGGELLPAVATLNGEIHLVYSGDEALWFRKPKNATSREKPIETEKGRRPPLGGAK